MPEYTAVSVEEAINTPPPYMDPGNSVAKKKISRIHKQSMASAKPCEHCGAPPQFQKSSATPKVVIWPAVRPENHIQQSSSTFIGYVIVIAVVIFLLFAACKYLP